MAERPERVTGALHEPTRGRFADPSDAPDVTARGRRGVRIEQAPSDAPDIATQRPVYRRLWFVIAAALVLAATAFFAIRYYLHARSHESTDDAFIEGNAVLVSPQASGTVLKVYVDDNQQVKAGDLLAELDARDYKARLQQAVAAQNAAIARRDQALANVALTRTVSSAAVAQAASNVRLAQAAADRDVQDLKRYQMLYDNDAVSRQRLDQVIAAARGSRAQLDEARARLEEANAAPDRLRVSREQARTADAEIAQSREAVAQAELDLSYTRIVAPESGRVTRKSTDEGQLARVGQPLMAIVYGEMWVTANFKETQLTHMRVGQPVEIKVDTYPDRRFTAHVESFQHGTGARFSALPAQNATGNYVKVVQRIPVKILFDRPPDAHLLAPGMSVVPDVDISASPDPGAIRRGNGTGGGADSGGGAGGGGGSGSGSGGAGGGSGGR